MRHMGQAFIALATGLAVVVPATTVGAAAAPTLGAAATTPPAGFVTTVIANSGIFAPTLMAFTPEGHIVISQQTGKIKIFHGGSVSATPYLSLNVSSTSDRGVLGIAFDPAYATNRYVYVYYHRPTPTIHGVISRFVVRANGLSADPATERVLYTMDSLDPNGVHTGGVLKFGPDGKLYVSVGDDGRGVTVSHSLTSDLGKILRINADGSIPTDNPFVAQATGKYRAIWSKGHRNPYTWTFDPRGRLLLAEVGLDRFEEINDVVPGGDYGWPDYEGPDNGDARFVDPVYAYGHGADADTGCAIIGAAVADPATSTFPAGYDGDFFFADYCSGWMKAYDPITDTATPFATGITTPTHIIFGPDGNLYYLTRNTQGGSGWITKISFTGSTAPSIANQPDDVTVGVGQSASFTVEAQGQAPLAYQWRRNGVNILGATQPSYTLANAQLSDSGAAFTVRVSNGSGFVVSDPAVLTVVSNQLPAPTITVPQVGTRYVAGQVIQYAGTATDPEDGALPASAFDWEIVFHHGTHTHPFLDPAPGSRSGSFTVPDSAFETAADVWFRVQLSVTDSGGRTTTTFRDVFPKTTTLSVLASPANTQITLDGTLYPSPHKIPAVQNMQRTIGAPSPQALAGGSWTFDTWSDGGAAQHIVRPTAAESRYFAVFRLGAGSVGAGTGLSATYFDDPNLTSPVVERIDPVVLLHVPATRGPAPGVAPGTWSVRWEGELSPQFTESHTFHILADDGVRLWVGGNLVIDAWTPAAASFYTSAPIALTAGTRVPIRVELRQGSGRLGQARLVWQSTSMPWSVIPSRQLFPQP
ncbi:MAG: PQQ-dependent sugar dehydrogenase [Acidimicrobiia bacterium]|nr:PQQ-dependent sugar dehydrogenase [Acidimicrobiia bacterium]